MAPIKPPSAPRPSESSFAHLSTLELAQAFVRRKTGLCRTGAPSGHQRNRVLEDVARALLAQARTPALASLHASDPDQAFEAAFGEVLLHKFEQDPVALWLVTEALVDKILHQRNRASDSRDSKTERGDKMGEARCEALDKLEGGRYPLRKFQEKVALGQHDEGLTFWKYFYFAVEKKTISWFRKLTNINSFWAEKASMDEASSSEDIRRLDPKDPHRVAERALIRAQRHEERRKAIQNVREVALKGAHPPAKGGKPGKPDQTCVVMLQYIDWLLARPEGESLDQRQADFAVEAGIPKGTVSSYLKRFREEFVFYKTRKAKREAELYSTSGGSQS